MDAAKGNTKNDNNMSEVLPLAAMLAKASK